MFTIYEHDEIIDKRFFFVQYFYAFIKHEQNNPIGPTVMPEFSSAVHAQRNESI